MACSIEEVLPRIRSLARRYAGPCVTAEDLESVGALAVIEAQKSYLGLGPWPAFAARVAQDRMRDEVRRSVKYDASRVLYDALSSSATIVMLRKHSIGGAALGQQDEDAYVSEIMSRLDTNALGKMLFAEAMLHGKISFLAAARSRRGRKKAVRTVRREMSEALESAKDSAEELLSEDSD